MTQVLEWLTEPVDASPASFHWAVFLTCAVWGALLCGLSRRSRPGR